MNNYPDKIENEEQLEDLLSRPGSGTIDMFSKLEGDLIFLGVSGKIGQSLARMAKRACDEGGVKKRLPLGSAVYFGCGLLYVSRIISKGVGTISKVI